MSSVMDKVNPNLLKTISKIAKRENTTEEAIINESLERTIEEKEIEEEKLKYRVGIPIEVVAEEFGETPEEFIKKLQEAEAEESIPLDVDKLEKELRL
ncbi:hypothetical protein MBCUT_10600 [Methanobrevibacter cuticularis]|uniref:Uncharacterized protein n=1 Tax=Methanobrevibacter cuticularis TaxID=47311 RepID=A0A166E240_9EURY|nr:hypothetical protein [Methanobrevibacter cuticularis]KZX16194.1 hypothetical protein MBCUT_10600 [Methanobrevibacter cuticularis]